jgi:1,4-dihydroxy-2-naphthoate octaprenyltransferase
VGLSSFLNLVEIKTKIASIIPFTLGTLYAVYRFHKFNLKNFILMLVTMLAFDMVTTAINNYIDFKKAKKTSGYNYEIHNAIVKYNLKSSSVMAAIVILLFIAVAFGFVLFLNTNIVVLVLGTISFIVGILYSYGPIPISRMPLGEIFSGLFMGFIIMFLSVYIHVYDQNIVSIVFNNGIVNISINIIEVLYIFLISLPLISGIANIMLANNICDVEDDIENKRYTLPVYIGSTNALMLYKGLYYAAYLSTILMIILRVEPIFSLASLITFLWVNKNIKLFYEKQTKKDTFITSVKNFVLINTVQIASIGASIIMNKL